MTCTLQSSCNKRGFFCGSAGQKWHRLKLQVKFATENQRPWRNQRQNSLRIDAQGDLRNINSYMVNVWMRFCDRKFHLRHTDLPADGNHGHSKRGGHWIPGCNGSSCNVNEVTCEICCNWWYPSGVHLCLTVTAPRPPQKKCSHITLS